MPDTMGGKRRDPDEYIFKKEIEPLIKKKRASKNAPQPKSFKPWIDLEELAFGKKKGKQK